MNSLIDQIERRTGLDHPAAAAATRIAIETIAAGLDHATQLEFLASLPDAPGTRVTSARGPVTSEELYGRMAHELGTPPAAAVELAQVVCHVIHDRLGGELRARLRAHLEPSLAEALAAPPSVEAPGASARHVAASGRTLASGRPGSERPLSEAHPGSDHPLSRGRPPRG